MIEHRFSMIYLLNITNLNHHNKSAFPIDPINNIFPAKLSNYLHSVFNFNPQLCLTAANFYSHHY
jgi:hypothetical protein